MNAETKVKAAKDVPDPLRIWNALSKTDPAHTKGFKRAGGFSGTAVKPMWVIKRLTEQFGPCGVGWGIGEPSFQVVDAGGETLVYCTVSCWHETPATKLYGVGGDKVVTKRANGPFCDDEAFKKAFTDAVNNAFKFIGVAADIHMGQFDDSKYLAEVTKEFAPPEPKRVPLAGPYTSKTALWTAVKAFDRTIRGIGDHAELLAFLDTPESRELIEQCKRDAPSLWADGLPGVPEFVPLADLIAERRADLEAGADSNILHAG